MKEVPGKITTKLSWLHLFSTCFSPLPERFSRHMWSDVFTFFFSFFFFSKDCPWKVARRQVCNKIKTTESITRLSFQARKAKKETKKTPLPFASDRKLPSTYDSSWVQILRGQTQTWWKPRGWPGPGGCIDFFGDCSLPRGFMDLCGGSCSPSAQLSRRG